MIKIEADSLINKLKQAQLSMMPTDRRQREAFTRIGLLTQAAIINELLKWKASGHLYQRGALINSIRYEVIQKGVRVYSAGVPYARVHEFGTKGKGGLLDDIKPKNVRWLTIPLHRMYERVRPRTLDLQFLIDKDEGKTKAWLWDVRRQRVAYRLLKKVSIPARPYFFPAVQQTTERRIQILRDLLAFWGN